jgi:hypothetical protein
MLQNSTGIQQQSMTIQPSDIANDLCGANRLAILQAWQQW